MSRVKKKRPPSGGFIKAGKQPPAIPCIPGQRTPKKDVDSKDRPKHTYSTRPHEYLKRRSPKPAKVAVAHRGVLARSPSQNNAEVPVTPTCAALPALIITPCRTRSASPPATKTYHQSCSSSPIQQHTPRTGHIPQRNFDSYALRYLAEKAIKHSRSFAKELNVQRELEQCRRYSCSPPPLKTRHKHYCGQKPYRRDGTVLQIMSNVLERGFDAFRSVIEDGCIGNSARYCRRRIKRLLRPIWCNCLRHTCLGPPSDPIQTYVLTRGSKARNRARNHELMKKFPRLPTPMSSSPELLALQEPESETAASAKEASNAPHLATPAISEPPSALAKAPGSTIHNLVKPTESPSVGEEHVFPKLQQLLQQKTKRNKLSSPSSNKRENITFSTKPTSDKGDKQKRANDFKKHHLQ